MSSQIVMRDGLLVVESDGENKYGAMISRANMQKVQAAHDAMVDMGATCKQAKNLDPDDLITYGGEIKALGNGRIGGYLVRYSGPSDPDLTNDYFDANTAITVPDSLPVLYHHGFDKTLKRRVIGSATTKRDPVGLWAEAQLNLRDEYEKTIYAMAEAGKLGYSSGAIAKSVTREQVAGVWHIKTWAIEECSLTPTPAEPRNGVMPLKSLLPPGGVADGEQKTVTEQPNKEIIDMAIEQDEIQAKIDAALAKRDAEVKAAADRTAELDKARDEGYKKAVAELKHRPGAPAYIKAENKGDDNEGAQAFKSWLQTGQHNGSLISPVEFLGGEQKAAFNITTGASGAYMVPDPLYNQIIAKLSLMSWARIAPVQPFSTIADHLLVPVEDTAMTAFTSTAEAAAYTENEATVAQVDLALTKYTKLIKVSEEFLLGENSNFEGWLAFRLAQAAAVTENTLNTTVLLAAATAGTAAASATALTIAEVERLAGTLGGGYADGSSTGFLMKRATQFYLRGIAYASYQTWATLEGKQQYFGGEPVYISDDMGAMTTGLRSTCFGNWNYFGRIERPGLMVQRNPYLYMANGQIGIFASMYRGAGVLQAEAFYTMAQA